MSSAPIEGVLENEVVGNDLPLTFKVKYLGSEHARGLWGIKHTRRPVDRLVTVAKTYPPNRTLPLCDLMVSLDGVQIETTVPSTSTTKKWNYSIDTISYGVQDLVYTRVFAMIVVKDNYNIKDPNPFDVHAFVCDSRALARKLTYALAASFQEYSKRVKEMEQQELRNDTQIAATKKKFAIDLRTPEEMQQTIEDQETEAFPKKMFMKSSIEINNEKNINEMRKYTKPMQFRFTYARE